MILIIDNYDSFTYNLYQFIGSICEDVMVLRNDKITVKDIENIKPDGIVISPGPKRPEDAGICVDVIREYGAKIPILGICLGHQAIGYVYGADINRAEEIKHGKISSICHNSSGVFKNIKSPMNVMRYHSLIVDSSTLPHELEITAMTEDGVIMGIRHKKYQVYGLQFHPESILTEYGMNIIKNFVEGICNVTRSN